MSFRQETDLLGSREVPADALWGIHTLRAMENFPIAGRSVHRELVHAFGAVKLAAARTNQELGCWDAGQVRRHRDRLPGNDRGAARRARRGRCPPGRRRHLDQHERQRGAGQPGPATARPAAGRLPRVSPHDDINLHQSTNDTYPTALRVAAIRRLRALERKVVALLEAFQEKEKEFADVVKIGRTELQDAVLMTLGREMAAYAEAFARDRWRIYKCEERLRVVNLGGTAIGTGLGAPRQYIFRVVEQLREITGLGLARAENLVEATQNADAFVEVSGILRTLAVNLLKIANDLRLLSSGPGRRAGRDPPARRGRPARRSCPARSIRSSPRRWPRPPWR